MFCCYMYGRNESVFLKYFKQLSLRVLSSFPQDGFGLVFYFYSRVSVFTKCLHKHLQSESHAWARMGDCIKKPSAAPVTTRSSGPHLPSLPHTTHNFLPLASTPSIPASLSSTIRWSSASAISPFLTLRPAPHGPVLQQNQSAFVKATTYFNKR